MTKLPRPIFCPAEAKDCHSVECLDGCMVRRAEAEENPLKRIVTNNVNLQRTLRKQKDDG